MGVIFRNKWFVYNILKFSVLSFFWTKCEKNKKGGKLNEFIKYFIVLKNYVFFVEEGVAILSGSELD